MQFFEEAELCMGKESRSKSLSLLQQRVYKIAQKKKIFNLLPLREHMELFLQTVSTLSAWLQCLISNALFHFMFRSYSPFFKEKDDQSSNYFSLVFQQSRRIQKAASDLEKTSEMHFDYFYFKGNFFCVAFFILLKGFIFECFHQRG